MNATLRRFTQSTLLCLLVLGSGAGVADDTEIYFSTGTSSGNTGEPLRPNVLFILDTSGSMTAKVAETGPDPSPGATSDDLSRIQVLKDAMTQIIEEVEDINLGLMRFTNTDGGPVLFPIRYIDEPAEDTLGEESDDPAFTTTVSGGSDDGEENNGTTAVVLTDATLDIAEKQSFTSGTADVEFRISSSSNDAEEENDGDMTLTGSSLDINEDNDVGLRFTNISVPQGATINSAFIDFWVRTDTGENPDVDIFIQNVDNASAISSNDDDLTDRSYWSTNVEWENVPDPSANTQVTTPDLKDQVQHIVSSSGWNPGQAMLFYFREEDNSNDESAFQSYDNSGTVGNNRHPRLRINYTYSVPAGSTEQTTAIRFQGINIPQGVTVNSAALVLTPQNTDSTASTWTIKAEKTTNSPALAATNGNLSGRTGTTAEVSWTVPAMTADSAITSPDLTSILQELVDDGGWCGGNAITLIITGDGTRQIKSYEQASSAAPKLTYTYEGSDEKGCFQDTDTAQAGTTTDDAEETTSTATMNLDSSTLNFQSGNLVGLRFRDLQIPKDAEVLSASIRFYSREFDSGTMTTTIRGQNIGDAPLFTTSDKISTRTQTTASVSWSETANWSTNSTYNTPDISGIIEEVVGHADWASGNDLVITFDTSTATDRRAYSYDSDANKGALLTVVFESSGGTENIKTVRDRLIELVNELPSSDYTPIVETMYEAAKYWRGDEVEYGLERDGSRYARLSHPGSYCELVSGVVNCHGADVVSHPPYGIDNPSGCDPDVNPDDSDCSSQDIEGSPSYISPFNSELTCAKNYQVLLTDGAANSLSTGVQTSIEGMIGGTCLSTNSDGNSYGSSERCGVDIAKYMFENDQSTGAGSLANDQTVTTYAIAFNLSDADAVTFLEDMAREGTGGTDDGFYSATDATDLVSIFSTILTDVKKDPTSFVAPSLATNAFNRLLSRDEVYFGLFTPDLNRRWFGNVKKYNICIDSVGDPSDDDDDCELGEILDFAGNSAIDPLDNKFRDTARSVWSDLIDGQATTKGGAGGEMVDYTTRIIYTDATSAGTAPALGTALNVAPHKIDIDTWNDTPDLDHVRSAVCPTPSVAPGSDCETRMLWLLGKVITPDSDNDASATTRWSMNDVLHSSPVVATYGGSDSDDDGVIDTFFDKIVVGTNEGGVRFLNGTTGLEEWTFVPQSMLDPQQELLYANAEADHLYGMDVTPTLYFKDVNGDGSIQPAQGDFIHAITAMRRGGKSIYSLDVTGSTQINSTSGTVVPKFRWRIDNTTSGFSRLGETWSQPRLARIYVDVAGTPTQKDVLIFGGGFDPVLDNKFADDVNSDGVPDTNYLGNAIYVVDAATGARILSISGTGSGADIEVSGMRYPIPSRITVLDYDGDFVDDRMYVGDLGGQVWRVDLAPDVETSGTDRAGSSVVGLLARLSTIATATEQRRFFEPPSVVQVKDTTFSDAAGGEYDYVFIGSGWRQHPLNKAVHDRFYALRDETIGTMTDSPANNIADSYPSDTTSNAPIANTDLIDITERVFDAGDADIAAIKLAKGWFFDFDTAGNDGEKVLSAPITIAGSVFFTTYQPDATTNSDACTAQIGGGSAYNFGVLTAAASVDWDDTPGIDPIDDRTVALGGGIPSDVVPVFTKEGIVGIVGIEGGAAQLGTLSDLPRFRTYWYEESGL